MLPCPLCPVNGTAAIRVAVLAYKLHGDGHESCVLEMPKERSGRAPTVGRQFIHKPRDIPDDHDMSGDRTGQEHFVYAPMDIPTDHSLLGDRTVQSQCSNAPGDIHIIQASAMKAQTLSNNAELFRITSFELCWNSGQRTHCSSERGISFWDLQRSFLVQV